MAFTHRIFDIPIKRAIDPARLRWPAPGEAGRRGEDEGFGGNLHYQDIRGFRWTGLPDVMAVEEEWVRRIETAANPEDEIATIQEERDTLFEQGEPDALWGLDLGVAATALAISASRCIPFTSCNGGAFNGRHQAAHPLVAFMLRIRLVEVFVSAAEQAGAGLYQEDGCAVVYGPDAPTMMRFGRRLYERRAEIDAIRVGRSKQAGPR